MPATALAQSSDADVKFVQDMIAHHEQALVMTKLVPERGDRSDIKLLAERIEASQLEEIGRMRTWLEARGVSATPSHHEHAAYELMPGMLTAQELERLERARGAAFDRLFLQFMIKHHEGALIMVKQLFSEPVGPDPGLFRFASDIDADQRAEIARMQRLLSTLKRGSQ